MTSIELIETLKNAPTFREMRPHLIKGETVGSLMTVFSKCQNCTYCHATLGGPKRCEGKVCLLKELGLIDVSIQDKGKSMSSDQIEAWHRAEVLSEILSQISYYSLHMVKEYGVLKDARFELQEDKKRFEAKRSKLGRPSKQSQRNMDYKRFFVDVTPKPSIEELSALVGVSPRTIYRDFKELGYCPPKKSAN